MHNVEAVHHTAQADAVHRAMFTVTILAKVMRAQIKIYRMIDRR